MKVVVIVKTDNATFRKWRVTSLSKFEQFLDKNHPTWRWYNVYDRIDGRQIANYTCKKRFGHG